MTEAAMLRGNKAEKELLGSLKNMNRLKIVHSSFPFQWIGDYVK